MCKFGRIEVGHCVAKFKSWTGSQSMPRRRTLGESTMTPIKESPAHPLALEEEVAPERLADTTFNAETERSNDEYECI